MAFQPSSLNGHLHNSEAFNYGVETQEAYKRGALSKDLVEEQKKVQEADLLIFQGWMDRVLVRGFAYDLSKVFDDGLLQGKLSLFSFTTGGSKDKYATRGDIRCLLWPMQTQQSCPHTRLPKLQNQSYASETYRSKVVLQWNSIGICCYLIAKTHTFLVISHGHLLAALTPPSSQYSKQTPTLLTAQPTNSNSLL
uniref:N-ribosyldihydronicotinamide:quinone reductase 2 n=1 Tax=Junco hyemalis TaxID=40217 RepID=A0A8C5IBS7_JUNHY